MITDPIADYLTRIRNAILVKHRVVTIPASKIKQAITKVLNESGYIYNYRIEQEENSFKKTIKIALKYNPSTKQSAIAQLTRVSKPGLRKNVKSIDLPRVLNGLGIAILSTSQGVINDKEARKLNIGGEVLCYIS